jgi:hypothetical protein
MRVTLLGREIGPELEAEDELERDRIPAVGRPKLVRDVTSMKRAS